MSFAPVILFVYNRPEHTRRTIEALQRNVGAELCDLTIYADAAKSPAHEPLVVEVRAYLRTVGGFKTVKLIERKVNMGLASSVIAGVTDALKESPSVVVMEDDLISAPSFLTFINAALSAFATRADVFSVTGYNYPFAAPKDYPEDAYLSYRSSSWGWATWADRWDKVDWEVKDYAAFRKSPDDVTVFKRGGDDLPGILEAQMTGQLDSWSIRFDFAHYRHNAFCLHPVRSLIHNIGFDGSGIHCDITSAYNVDLDETVRPFSLRSDLQPDPRILKRFDLHLRPSTRPPLIRLRYIFARRWSWLKTVVVDRLTFQGGTK